MVFPFGIGCDDDTPARGRLRARLIAVATVAQPMRPFHSVSLRKYEIGSYEDMCDAHRWEVPERYNIARDVCDKHEPDRLAMVWEDWEGNERRVTFGELRELSKRFASVLEEAGVERGDRVATLLPSLPETAAVFLGTYKRGAILLSMSVLYGDEGIQHRLRDSQAGLVVT